MLTDDFIDISLLDNLIIGRVEPQIYVFSTDTVPNYLKVGDTYRPIETRLNEWRKYFPQLKREFVQEAKADSETYFRDFSVHSFLENDRKKKRLQRDVFPKLPYFSNEFFENAEVQDIIDAIDNIKKSHQDNDGRYQLYRFETSHIPVAYTYSRTENYDPRPNQQKTIDKFKLAIKKGRRNLLMYAVMRFGKSFTSMCCATEILARVVVVVSAKADVKEEWKRTVESHKRFEDYCFLDSDVLLQSETIISEKLNNGEKVVVFLTLQDLQGPEIKSKHQEIFDNQIDLIIIDETHFGARASEYGKVLEEEKLTIKEQKNELKETDITLDELETINKILNAKVRLHLSGTPYRILMNSEFSNDDIIAFYQFSDIAEDQEKWNIENLNKDDVREWDNPYYGFPKMIRFAFNPNEASRRKMEELKQNGITYTFSALFKPKSITKDSISQNHKKFEHEPEILDLLKVIDGSKIDKNLLGFLNYDKIKEGNMCRHIVCVLPFRASCDALEQIILDNKSIFENLNSYEIINISGVDNENRYKDTKDVKLQIKNCEINNKKTITLTVNRMLTGSTVEEWDTMLYFKDSASPQEYDQAIFRLQNQYIKIYSDPKGDVIKYNMKPQTLLVDFDPNRMFRMQEQKSQIYNVNNVANGNTKLEARIKRELEVSPIVVLNKNKIVQVNPADILDEVRKYSSNKSVLEEATVLPVDFSLLEDSEIRAEIEKQGKIGSSQGLEIKPLLGEGEEMDIPPSDTQGSETPTGGTEPTNTNNLASEKEESDFKSKFATYYAKILFFAFLTLSDIKSLQEIIKGVDENENNKRIASSLDLNKDILILLQTKINPFILSKLDYKIQNINTLGKDNSLLPIERASNALKKFSRLSESEVATPEKITDAIINAFPKEIFTESVKIIDIAAKQGEFLYATYKKYGKEVAGNFYSIPTSKVAYEFTRKVYELLDLEISHILKEYTSYDLIKDGNNIFNNDKIKIGSTDMKFDVIVGNPPYQQSDEGHSRSAGPIYHKFINQAKKLNPQYLSMIIPARWFAGGKGLNQFRTEMLGDKRIRKIVDFENSNDVFSGVDVAGGICYFLWDRDNSGLCEVTNFINGEEEKSERALDEFPIFIRHIKAIPIIKKVIAKKENEGNNLSNIVSSRKPFGLPTNYSPRDSGIPCYFIQRIGLKYASKNDISDENNLIKKWKFLVPKSPIAGQTDFSKPIGFYYDGNTRIAKPGECCTESFIVAGAFETKKEVEAYKSYIFTKVVRFLLLQTVISQDVTKNNFQFIPDLGKYEGIYTDEILCKRWGITKKEWIFIDSRIKTINN